MRREFELKRPMPGFSRINRLAMQEPIDNRIQQFPDERQNNREPVLKLIILPDNNSAFPSPNGIALSVRFRFRPTLLSVLELAGFEK